MKALYRKYRPTKLADVVGQEQVVKALTDGLKNKKINHAYVFAGPRGTGKTSVARIFAHTVNGFDYQLEDDYLDIIEIDAASNNGVDNIRELREKAIIAPTKGKYKVYIIDEAHMLSKSAENALLKLLEEPPEHVIFILATTEIDKILPTILSRTQVFMFRLAEPEVMTKHLAEIAKKEKINIDQSGLEVITRRGGGSFRDSLSLLDQVATLTDQKITAAVLEEALGIPSQEKIRELLQNYRDRDASRIEQNFKDLLASGLRAENIASELLTEIIAHPEASVLPLLKSLPEVAPPFGEAKLLLALLEECMDGAETKVINASKTAEVSGVPKVPKAPKSLKIPEVSGVSEVSAVLEAAETPKDPEGAKPISAADFDWGRLVETVASTSPATAKTLEKARYDVSEGVLNIYPDSKFSAQILQSPKHGDVLKKAIQGLDLKIHTGGASSVKPKDETIAKISAIMGDVQEIDGSVPF